MSWQAPCNIRLWFGSAITVLMVAIAGCGGTKKGTVTGKVTLDNKMVSMAKVKFVKDGQEFATTVSLGRYSIDLEPGEYKVFLESTMPPAKVQMVGAPKAPKDVSKGMKDHSADKSDASSPPSMESVDIPLRYKGATMSKLTCTVQLGENTYDIPMSSK
jgi:hypothetical protein